MTKYDIDRADDTLVEKLLQVGLPLRGTYFIATSTALIIGATVSAVAAIGSGIASYVQGNAQASAARDQADYTRAMAARNQALANQAAQAARAKGAYEQGLQIEELNERYCDNLHLLM